MENWKKEFARVITERIGIKLKEDNIYPDNNWSNQIANLNFFQPIIFAHYKGILFVVMSEKDYERLEKGKINPERYINSAVWNYGYFKGGRSYNAAYWFSFNDEVGLYNSFKISKYLKQQLQVIEKWKTGSIVSIEMKEYSDFDPRFILVTRAKQRVEAMNCKVDYITADAGKDEDNLSVIKIGGIIELSISSHLLNQSLYYPNRLNEWLKRVNDIDIYCLSISNPERSVKAEGNFDIGAWIDEQKEQEQEQKQKIS